MQAHGQTVPTGVLGPSGVAPPISMQHSRPVCLQEARALKEWASGGTEGHGPTTSAIAPPGKTCTSRHLCFVSKMA